MRGDERGLAVLDEVLPGEQTATDQDDLHGVTLLVGAGAH